MTDLTEQWKKGELKKNKYWVKYKNGKIDTWELSEGITIESKPEIIEVLAPVPSFKEWQAKLEENTKLKELLKECREPLEVLAEKRNTCDWYPEDVLAKLYQALGEDK